MKTVRIIGLPDGRATPHDGRWLVDYDPDTRFGDLRIVTSGDRRAARCFETLADLVAYLRRTSAVQPTRPDGRPNRPITGLTIEISNA